MDVQKLQLTLHVKMDQNFKWEDSLWQDKKKIAHHDWFIFPVFNASIIEFMRDTMGSDFTKLDIKDAYPVYVSKTRKDFSAVTQALKSSFAK